MKTFSAITFTANYHSDLSGGVEITRKGFQGADDKIIEISGGELLRFMDQVMSDRLISMIKDKGLLKIIKDLESNGK